LTITGELSSRFDDIANAGNARMFTRRNSLESRFLYAFILQHKTREIFAIQF
jgi:hypothetical protein